MNSSRHPSFLQKCVGLALVCSMAGNGVLQAQVTLHNSTSHKIASEDEAVVEQAVTEATSRIQKLATTDPAEFATILHNAFGQRLNPNVERDLVQKAAHRQLPLPKRILFVPSKVLAGAAAAYAAENGGVLLINAEFRERSAALPDLITHEWGHHLDAILGPGDAPGEEGQIFLTGVKNSGPILAALQGGLAAFESHDATIEFEGRTITVELGFFDFITKPFKALVNIVKAAVNTVVDTVKSTVSLVKNVVKTVGNAVVGVAQGVASGVMRAVGQTKQADELKAKAESSFKNSFAGLKGAAGDVVNRIAAAGDLYNKAKTELNKVIPHLGTVLDVAVSFTPAGPYAALTKGVTDVKNAYEKGGMGAALKAGAFAGLDVGGSVLGRVASGIKAAKIANAVGRGRSNAVVAKEALSKWDKVKGVVQKGEMLADKVKSTTLESTKLTKGLTQATKGETALGKTLFENWKLTTKAIDVFEKVRKIDTVVRSKDWIPGRDRDANGKLLGTGGSEMEKRFGLAPTPPPPVVTPAVAAADPLAAIKAKAAADAQAAAKAKAAADAEAAKAKALADALAAARLKAAADVQAAAKARGATDAQLAATAKAQADAAKAQAAADAKARVDAAKAQGAANKKAEADADAKLRADVAKLSADAATKAKADAAAQAQADADAKAKAAIVAKTQADAVAKANTDAAVKAQAAADAAKAQADAAKGQADADAKTQAAADAKAKADAAKAQAVADAKAQAAADAKAKADADALTQQKEDAEQVARKARELAQHEKAVADNARKKAAEDDAKAAADAKAVADKLEQQQEEAERAARRAREMGQHEEAMGANARKKAAADAPKEEPAAEAEPPPAGDDPEG